MSEKTKRALNNMVMGFNSIFLGDTTLLEKHTWIKDDAEAICLDWEAIGFDITEAAKEVGSQNVQEPQQQEVKAK